MLHTHSNFVCREIKGRNKYYNKLLLLGLQLHSFHVKYARKKYKTVTSAYLSVRPWLGGCYYFVMYIYGAFVWKNNRFLDWFLFLFCGCMCAGCLKLLSTLAVSVWLSLALYALSILNFQFFYQFISNLRTHKNQQKNENSTK